MTTIAVRGRVMAADSLITDSNDNVVGFSFKIKRLSDGALAAWCGDRVGEADFFDAVNPAVARTAPEATWQRGRGIVLRPTGTVEFYEGPRPQVVCAEYFAIGSGAETARGAMAVGATAREAVEAAIKHDVCSGGEVSEMSVGGGTEWTDEGESE